jgi:hypothetical protein
MPTGTPWAGSPFPHVPTERKKSLPTASTADQKSGVVTSMRGFITGPFSSPFSMRNASRPTYFWLYRVSSMFHSLN